MSFRQEPQALWLSQIEKLKEMFPELMDTVFTYDYGTKEVMMMSLQKKLNKSREELDALLIAL